MKNIKVCPECGKEGKSISKNISVWNVRGEDVMVDGNLNYCPHCDALFLDDVYDNLQERAFRIYREKHGLLSSSEIRNIRERYGFTQELFARILGIGVASLRRYEGGSLQTSAIDTVLRSAESPKSLMTLFERNSRDLTGAEIEHVSGRLGRFVKDSFDKEFMLGEIVERSVDSKPSFLNGFKSLSLDKVKGLVAYLLKLNGVPICITKMCKLMFYCDFAYFKETTQSISGLSYAHYTHGPVPEGIHDMYTLFNYLRESGVIEIEEEECDGLCEGTRRDFALRDQSSCSFLSDEEKKSVEKVFNKLGKLKANKLSDMSHEEDGYLVTSNNEKISYEYAETLKAV